MTDSEATFAAEGPFAAAGDVLRDVAVNGFVLAGACVCWVGALRGADLGRLSGYGLLTALPPLYFAALAILVTGFVCAVSVTPVRPAILGAYVFALVVMLHATTAILYPEPRYSWTYKHLGVVDYIGTHGETHRWIDIYQNWPAFFAATAWLANTAGVSPSALAPWAQVFFEVAAVAAIVFALRGLTRDPRLVWSAAWLYVAANWIGQDYLSPQALAFVLSTIVLGLALRWRPAKGRDRSGRAEEVAWMQPRAIVLVGAVCSAAVIVSHQLSPIILIADLAGLWLLTRRPTIPALVALVAAEVGWLILAWTFLSEHFRLFDLSSSLNARGEAQGQPLPGVALGLDAARLSMLAVGVLALIGFVRASRAGRRLLVPAVLVMAPFAVAAGQSYGGEGPLRAYLFALPWLALLAAEACTAAAGAVTRILRPGLLLAATVVVGTGTLFGYFGQETLNYMTADDVAASRWFLDHSRPEARVVYLAPNFPDRVDAHYVDHLDESNVLIRHAGVSGAGFASKGMTVLERILHADREHQQFVIVSPSQERYLHYYGLAPDGAAARLTGAIQRSPDFQLVYRHGASRVFVFTPAREQQ
jgi:hypothetical protein